VATPGSPNLTCENLGLSKKQLTKRILMGEYCYSLYCSREGTLQNCFNMIYVTITAVTLLYFIWAGDMNNRQFLILLQVLKAENNDVLHHPDDRWLS
jgi:hypothetical protein